MAGRYVIGDLANAAYRLRARWHIDGKPQPWSAVVIIPPDP
jgi:hypothetical protein